MAILVYSLDKSVHEAIDRSAIIDQVVIVENDDEVLLNGVVDLVGDRNCKPVYREIPLAPRLKCCSGLLPETRKTSFDGSDKMGQKCLQILIRSVQGIPAERPFGTMGIINQQGCFAIAGWCRYKNQSVIQ
ncbi:MAG: hypothetical protein JXA78_14075 [Anaerolineales bacterium]|nr:hypothetical protein [Anaerolineales bacterium]